MMIGPDPRMRMVSRSSRRGTYASPLFPDSLRIAVISTQEKPPHTHAITTIIVIHVAAVMGCCSALRGLGGWSFWANSVGPWRFPAWSSAWPA